MKDKFVPKIDISVDEKTGIIRAAYLRIRNGKVHETREVSEGSAFADYDKNGWPLGIELLGPCNARVLDKLAKKEFAPIKRFLRLANWLQASAKPPAAAEMLTFGNKNLANSICTPPIYDLGLCRA